MINVDALHPTKFVQLLRADAQNISRDPIFVLMISLAILFPVQFFYFQDKIDNWATDQFGIVAISQYIAVVVAASPAVMIGWVVGFLLLEDRDDGPLLAMEATSIGKMGFITYRLSVAFILCFCATLIASNLVFDHDNWFRFVLSLIVAINAANVALILLAIARNKVEGLALSKLLNMLILFPLIAAIPSVFRFVAAFVPFFWLGETFGWSSDLNPGPIPSLFLALVISGIWLVIFYAMTAKRLG